MDAKAHDPATRVVELRKLVKELEIGGEPKELSKTLVELGLALADQGNLGEAIEELERTLPLTEMLDNEGAQASLLGMLGVFYARAGHPRESSEKFIAALKAMEDISPNIDEQFQCLMGIGRNLVALGDLLGAITQYTEAENLARQRVLPQEELDAIASKIVLHEQRGEYKDVVPLYKRAITLFRLLGDQDGGVAMLRGLAGAYGKLGKRELAKKCMQMWEREKVGRKKTSNSDVTLGDSPPPPSP